MNIYIENFYHPKINLIKIFYTYQTSIAFQKFWNVIYDYQIHPRYRYRKSCLRAKKISKYYSVRDFLDYIFRKHKQYFRNLLLEDSIISHDDRLFDYVNNFKAVFEASSSDMSTLSQKSISENWKVISAPEARTLL